MFKHFLKIIISLKGLLLVYLLVWAFVYRIPASPPTLVDLRQSVRDRPYYVAICAALASNLHGFPGHAYVIWSESLPLNLRDCDARGFVPANAGDQIPSLWRKVPGALVPNASDGNKRNFDAIVVIVDKATYDKSKMASQNWNAKVFKVGSRDCVAFATDISKSLGLTIPKSNFNYPQDFIAKLKLMNSNGGNIRTREVSSKHTSSGTSGRTIRDISSDTSRATSSGTTGDTTSSAKKGTTCGDTRGAFVATALLNFLTIFFAGSAHAYMEGYTPLAAADKNNKVKLATISDAGLRDGKVLTMASADVNLPAEGDSIVFTGKDSNGKTWVLSKHYYGLGTSFFTADLDGNGETDIILLQATGACGIAPPAVLTTILFDKQKRPFPTETSGYFSAADDAWTAKSKTATINDIIQIGQDKHAVIVCNQLAYAEIKGKSHSYWRTQMYRIADGRWQKLASYKAHRLPMIVRYTQKPNEKVIPTPVPALNTYEDGSFSMLQEKTCKRGRLQEVSFKDDEIAMVKIGTDTFNEPARWGFFQSFVIHATPDKYEVMSLDIPETKNLLKGWTNEKKQVKYSAPSMKGRFPLYTWVSD